MTEAPSATRVAPVEWPAPGPIDLEVHDLPHAAAPAEWWYIHAHLETGDGRPLALFASFFRVVSALDQERQPVYAHSLVRAVTDLTGKRYLPESRIDRDAPRIGREKLDRGEGSRDARLRRAVREVVDRGQVPYPDQLFSGEVRVATDRLDLDFGTARFRKLRPGQYLLFLAADDRQPGCELQLELTKPSIRNGRDGVVSGVDGREMFYYFVPRCRVTGEVTLDGETLTVHGDGWYDHEFGRASADDEGAAYQGIHAAAWIWVAAQLADGTEVCAYEMVRPDSGELIDRRALVIDSAGERHEFLDFMLTPQGRWRSTRTFNEYPTAWRLVVPAAGIELEVKAEFADQELITLISKPAFWEGRCRVRGLSGGTDVTGHAYVERSGFATVDTLEEFFSAVGQEVRKSVCALVPRPVPYEHARELIASKEREHYMEGVCLETLSRALADPVREITDRGGKAWRSYAALACCDIVGGDSRQYVQWLAMPELLHVGSLIVDDVEDGSSVRRGGPSCHLIHGEPLAINAGTACYFLGHNLLLNTPLDDANKLRVYGLYFEALRAGHAGQALDLYGLGEALAAAVQTGDGVELEKRVLAIHRLKTAAPAASLARMGAIAGKGTEVQIEALGSYFEALGCAFQIMDDVLNLRGFAGKLKVRGEDISRGLVTMPVAKAMSRLELAGRQSIAAALAARPKEPTEVLAVIEALEACGAVQACADQAGHLIESAWQRLDPIVEPSLPKIMLRAFGWFILERHY